MEAWFQEASFPIYRSFQASARKSGWVTLAKPQCCRRAEVIIHRIVQHFPIFCSFRFNRVIFPNVSYELASCFTFTLLYSHSKTDKTNFDKSTRTHFGDCMVLPLQRIYGDDSTAHGQRRSRHVRHVNPLRKAAYSYCRQEAAHAVDVGGF